MSRKKWIALLCGTFATFFFLGTPSKRKLDITYEVKGEFQNLDAIPNLLERKALSFQVPIHCETANVITRIECSQPSVRWTSAENFQKVLGEILPATFGKIPEAEFKNRLLKKSQSLVQKTEKLSQTESRFTEVDKITEKLFRDVTQQRKLIDQLKIDLDNREKQLSMFEEVLHSNPTANPIFSQKSAQVRQEIESLKSRIQADEKKLSETSKPLEERDQLQLQKDSLKDGIKTLEKKLAAMNEHIQSTSINGTYDDPEYFQINVATKNTFITTKRNLAPLLWAPLIGFLFFLLWTRNPHQPFRESTFSSPREVSLRTNLQFFKRISAF